MSSRYPQHESRVGTTIAGVRLTACRVSTESEALFDGVEIEGDAPVSVHLAMGAALPRAAQSQGVGLCAPTRVVQVEGAVLCVLAPIAGNSLARKPTEPFSTLHIVHIASALANTLSALHGTGQTHGALRPEWVFVTPMDGVPSTTLLLTGTQAPTAEHPSPASDIRDLARIALNLTQSAKAPSSVRRDQLQALLDAALEPNEGAPAPQADTLRIALQALIPAPSPRSNAEQVKPVSARGLQAAQPLFFLIGGLVAAATIALLASLGVI